MIQDEESIDAMLKPLTVTEFGLLDTFMKRYPSENCDFNVCVLLSWGVFFKLEYAVYHGRLVLFNPYYSYLLAPIGERLTAGELFRLNNCCKRIHKDVEIMVVSEDYVKSTPNIDEFFTIYNDENWNDYVYLAESLVTLSGKKLAKKKNLISQFKALYPDYVMCPIEQSDFAEIMGFCHYWKQTYVDVDHSIEIEFAAIENTMKSWDLFPCRGLKLYVQDRLCAFSIFSPQTQEMATVHFEKYDPNIKGAGQVINNETAKILAKDFKYINREQDMGIPGIRQAKRSYQPIKTIPYYRLKSK